MTKIEKFYLDKAKYEAIDNLGNEIFFEIDYWNNIFKLSRKNLDLELYAKRLLKNKHRINFIHKMLE